MTDNLFFKPTVLYKEFMILDLIEKNSKITQREIAVAIGVAVSMVNSYLDEYESRGLINRKYRSTKTVEYFVTSKGLERRKLLNIWYLQSAHSVYFSAKDNIIAFLNQIIDKGFKKILLYGAGEVAEIMLQVLHENKSVPIEVFAVIDDDERKQGKSIVNTPIIAINQIAEYQYDGIFLSSYTHHKVMYEKLQKMNYKKNQILLFFE